MTVEALANALELSALVVAEPEREIDGVYIGDLLSWVMGRAKSDNVWITIMSNINVIAVATLADVSCVILAEGVSLDEETLAVARAKGVNLYTSPKTAYQLAAAIAALPV